MGTAITVTIGDVKLFGELNDSETARQVAELLPLELRMTRWGGEYYGSIPIVAQEARDARAPMAVGELAVWPPGNALCVFFGPTPASTGAQPVAASNVNPIGRIIDDVRVLEPLGERIMTKWQRSEPATPPAQAEEQDAQGD